MATSTIPAAIDALLALLRTAAPDVDLDPEKVVDGFPRFTITDSDFIAIGGRAEPTVDGTQSAGPIGNHRRDENYTIRVACSSSKGGKDQKLVRDRAFALMGVVEDVVRDHPTLSGTVRLAQVGGSVLLGQTDFETAGKGVWAEVSFDVAVQARI